MQKASHALQANVAVLSAIRSEGVRRRVQQQATASQLYDDLDAGLDDAIRELSFATQQVTLEQGRLDRTTAAIRDLIALRDTRTIEQMTVRSLTEARAVRLIAIVTLIFLPPTVVSGFLQLDYIHVAFIKDGLLHLTTDIDVIFWVILTAPLLLATLGGWLIWDWRASRKSQAAYQSIMSEKA